MKISNISHDQQLAIDLCCDLAARIVGITGPAGTGKTTVLGVAVEELKDAGYTVRVAAPTGRAAERIRENSGHYAQTCHRLLGFGMPDPDDPNDFTVPARNRENPIPADVVFIDESSMLSDVLYRNLVDALRPGASIRFFGDMNQLPPVEGQSPFRKVLQKWPSVILQENFRSQSGIIQASQKIINGILPVTNDEVTMLNVGTSLGLTTLDRFVDEEYMTTDAQVIIPTKKGKYGTQAINKYIQMKLNKEPRTIALSYILEGGYEHNNRFRPKDKIIWTKNDYKLNLFNGMIGYIVNFDEDEGAIVCNFAGRDVVVPPLVESYDTSGRGMFRYDPRKYIDLAYAITTHKAQGSEFNKVLLLLNKSGALSRYNFYTAVTRAKKHVTVIAGPGGLKYAMRTELPYQEKVE